MVISGQKGMLMSGISRLLAALRTFWENPIVLSGVLSWFLAQFIKALVVLLKSRKKRAGELMIALAWKTGGMPSSHAALVCAMTAAVGFRQGLGSDLFAVTVFMSMVVIRDAVGVRRSSGLQARSLNHLGRLVNEKMDVDFHAVKEVQGHTPLEVLAGSILGVVIAGAVCYL
jgi:acid phosphatase family membrane protein YuiD